MHSTHPKNTHIINLWFDKNLQRLNKYGPNCIHVRPSSTNKYILRPHYHIITITHMTRCILKEIHIEKEKNDTRTCYDPNTIRIYSTYLNSALNFFSNSDILPIPLCPTYLDLYIWHGLFSTSVFNVFKYNVYMYFMVVNMLALPVIYTYIHSYICFFFIFSRRHPFCCALERKSVCGYMCLAVVMVVFVFAIVKMC